MKKDDEWRDRKEKRKRELGIVIVFEGFPSDRRRANGGKRSGGKAQRWGRKREPSGSVERGSRRERERWLGEDPREGRLEKKDKTLKREKVME